MDARGGGGIGQTRGPQKAVSERTCGFDSHPPHSLRDNRAVASTRRRRRRLGREEPQAQSELTRHDSKLATVEELCSFARRLAGTDAERRAANAMAVRLREAGRRTEIEPIYVHPQAPLV